MIIFKFNFYLLVAFITKNVSTTSINDIPLTLVLNRLPLEITLRHSCKCGDVSKNILAASIHSWPSRYPKINFLTNH